MKSVSVSRRFLMHTGGVWNDEEEWEDAEQLYLNEEKSEKVICYSK